MSAKATKQTLEIGDTCYSQHGQQATLIARSAGSYIVRPIFEDDDGEHEGEIETWSTAFRTPPAPKLDKETAEAEQRLAELRKQYSELRAQHYQLESDSKARMERLKQHEALAELDGYLSGGITQDPVSKQIGILPLESCDAVLPRVAAAWHCLISSESEDVNVFRPLIDEARHLL